MKNSATLTSLKSGRTSITRVSRPESNEHKMNDASRKRRLLGFELMEARLCMASIFDLSVVAKVDDSLLTSISHFPSINDSDVVAVAGETSKGSVVAVAKVGGAPPRLITGPGDANVTYLSTPQINNSGSILTTRSSDTPISFDSLDLWNQDATPSFERLASVGGNGTAIFAYASLSNMRETAFAALDSPGAKPTIYRTSAPENSTTLGDPVASFNSPQPFLRPMMADNGDLVVRVDLHPNPVQIMRVYTADGKQIDLASTLKSLTDIDGVTKYAVWSKLGAAPGISDDGQAIAFYGNLTPQGAAFINIQQDNDVPLEQGEGIFCFIRTEDGVRHLRRLAGESGNGVLDPGERWDNSTPNNNNQGVWNGNHSLVVDAGEDVSGFSAFLPDRRISVNHADGVAPNFTSRFYKIAFIGSSQELPGVQPGQKLGVFTARIKDDATDLFAPVAIIKTGDPVPGLGNATEPGLGNATDFSINDAVNNRGHIAFWVATDSGKQAIVVASGKDPVYQTVEPWGSQPYAGKEFEAYLDKVAKGTAIDSAQIAADPTLEPRLRALYDSGKLSLRNKGCLISSLSMAIDRLGYDGRSPLMISQELEKLHGLTGIETLKYKDGIALHGRKPQDKIDVFKFIGIDPDWNAVKAMGLHEQHLKRKDWSDEGFLSKLKQEIANKKQIVIEINTKSGNGEVPGGHYVLLSKIDGNKISYIDPELSTTTKLSEVIVGSGDLIKTAILLSKTSTGQSQFKVQSKSPIEFVITTPGGQKVGYDPTSQTSYASAPESYYDTIAPIAINEESLIQEDIEEVDSFLPRLATAADAVPGVYSVKVFGIGDGPYTLMFDAVSSSGNVVSKEFSGNILKGQTAIVTFDASSLANIAPKAADDTYEVRAGGIASLDVAINDTDSDGAIDRSSLSIIGAPSHGTASVDLGSGRIFYTPAASYLGSDQFSYTVRDNSGSLSNAAIVELNVSPVENIALWLNTLSRPSDKSISTTASAARGGVTEIGDYLFSGDGRYVVYSSGAINAVEGQVDDNFASDVFLTNLETRETVLVSHSIEGLNIAGNGGIDGSATERTLSISQDGRFVAFASSATNLVAAQIDPFRVNVFLYDRDTKRLRLVSHTVANPLIAANSDSTVPQISEDGRYVVYSSKATNLIASAIDPDEYSDDVFLYDRILDSNVLVSHASGNPLAAANDRSGPAGAGGAYTNFAFSISSDGRYVPFTSKATNLVAGQVDENGVSDIFLYDRVSNTSSLVTHAATSTVTTASKSQYSSVPGLPSITPDGRWVTYSTRFTNLVDGIGDLNNRDSVFLYDRTLSKNFLISSSEDASLKPANGDSFSPVTSNDGNVVSFVSRATDIVSAGAITAGTSNLYIVNRSTGERRLVTHQANSEVMAKTNYAYGNVDSISMSDDGRWLSYASSASNLVAGQVQSILESKNIFLYDSQSKSSILISHALSLPLQATAGSFHPIISKDGRALLFGADGVSSDTPLVLNDLNLLPDLFLSDLSSNKISAISIHAPNSPALTGNRTSQSNPSLSVFSTSMAVSADAKYVAFSSDATNLIDGQIGNATSLYLRQLDTNETILVSHRFDSPKTVSNLSFASYSFSPAISDDGRYVAYASNSTDLVQGQIDLAVPDDIFLYDRVAGTSRLVSHRFDNEKKSASSGAFTGNGSFRPLISADGRFVTYVSSAYDILSGQSSNGNTFNIWQYDRETGLNRLVNHEVGSQTSAARWGASFVGAISTIGMSADGEFVVYSGDLRNLIKDVSGPTSENVYIFDNATDANALVSHAANSAAARGNSNSAGASISRDGNYVAYSSESTDLVANQVTRTCFDVFQSDCEDVFLYNRSAGSNELVSHVPGKVLQVGNQGSSGPHLSANGQVVVFTSLSTNLISGQIDGFTSPSREVGGDIFAYDRLSKSMSLITHSADSPVRASNSSDSTPLVYPAIISPDGRFISFVSAGANLVSGATDTNATGDLFLHDRVTGENRLVAGLRTDRTAAGKTFDPLMSADGTLLLFHTDSKQLFDNDYNEATDIGSAAIGAPVVRIIAVQPERRNTAVATMEFVFRMPVIGFSIEDLKLTRDNGPNLLTGSQSLSFDSTSKKWSLQHLESLTSSPGHYSITVLKAASPVKNAFSGVPIETSQSYAWEFVTLPLSWQNPRNSLDVDDNGVITPLDALLIINEMNLRRVSDRLGFLPVITSAVLPPPFFDCNGSGFISPLDILLVINALNLRGGEGEAVKSHEWVDFENSNDFNATAVPLDFLIDDLLGADINAQRRKRNR